MKNNVKNEFHIKSSRILWAWHIIYDLNVTFNTFHHIKSIFIINDKYFPRNVKGRHRIASSTVTNNLRIGRIKIEYCHRFASCFSLSSQHNWSVYIVHFILMTRLSVYCILLYSFILYYTRIGNQLLCIA